MKKSGMIVLLLFLCNLLSAGKLFGQDEQEAAFRSQNLCKPHDTEIIINKNVSRTLPGQPYVFIQNNFTGDSCKKNIKPGLNNPVNYSYPTSLPFDITAGSILAGGFIYTEFIMKKCPLITEDVRSTLKTDDIPGIDKWVINKYNPDMAERWDRLSYIPVGIAMAGATEAVFMGPDCKADLNNFFILSETVALDLALTAGIKNTVYRFRPYTYITDKTPDSLNAFLVKSARESFPSGHTSTVACLSFYTAMMVNKYSDNCALKTTTWIAAATLPAITGLTRNLAGWHFTTDVMAGYALGAICGIGIPLLHDYLIKDKKIKR